MVDGARRRVLLSKVSVLPAVGAELRVSPCVRQKTLPCTLSGLDSQVRVRLLHHLAASGRMDEARELLLRWSQVGQEGSMSIS